MNDEIKSNESQNNYYKKLKYKIVFLFLFHYLIH